MKTQKTGTVLPMFVDWLKLSRIEHNKLAEQTRLSEIASNKEKEEDLIAVAKLPFPERQIQSIFLSFWHMSNNEKLALEIFY